MPRHPRSTPPSVATNRGWHVGWSFAALVLVALLAYWPALRGELLWDDHGHVTRHDLQSLSGLGRIWSEFGATQQYYPMLHSAFWLEHRLWGDATPGYHLLNVLLHATAACQFLVLLRRLAIPGATLAAFLFALHPVCVESVAWISEQKNTLSLVFYLAAALAYIRFGASRRPPAYFAACAWFVLALLTKTVTASLPAALLVVAWWRHGRIDWRRDFLPLLPWFVIALAAGLVTAHFERVLIGAQGEEFNLNAVQRCMLAGRVFWFYLGKLAWPADLIFIYPRWTIDLTLAWQWLFPAGVLALLSALVWWSRRQRGPLAAALLFGGALFPVLGFFNVFPFVFSYVADHFQYLASLPVFALSAVGISELLSRMPPVFRHAAIGVLLAVLGVMTRAQSAIYRDPVTLYEATLRRNPNCWMAHNNLATLLTLKDQPAAAIPHLESAIKLNPGMAAAYSNLGDSLTRVGRAQDAIPHLEKALQLQPAYATAHSNLGNALLELGRLDEAMAQYEKAITLDAAQAGAECNLGIALAQSGRTAEAITHFERATKIDPGYVDAEVNWAVSLMLTQGFPDAIPHFDKALKLNPNSIDAHATYGRALLTHGQSNGAIEQFEEVLRLDPAHADAHMSLALAFRQIGRGEEAATHYLEAVRLNPSLAGSR
jgi:protein O-mannosyl-transferase